MFGQELTDFSILGSLGIAFFAGILSFLSPCVLPIVPPYLAFMAGSSISEAQSNNLGSRDSSRVAFVALAFVLGLSTVFLVLGFAAFAFGSFFIHYQNELRYLSGFMVLAFGLHFLKIINFGVLNKELRLNFNLAGGKILSAYFFGLAFAFGWTPCIGPILGAILSMSLQSNSAQHGAALMLFYAIGLGLPFLFTGVFFANSLHLIGFFKRYTKITEKLIGVLLISIGFLLISDRFSILSFWLLENIPFLSAFG